MLKQCLLYFGLFHEDYDIPARRLIVLWFAEGVLLQQQGGGKEETLECVAEKLLNSLIQQNMIQVAKWKINWRVKTCRMNYLLRYEWLSKAKEAFFPHGSAKAMICKSSPSGTGLREDPMPMLRNLPILRIRNLFFGSYTGKTMLCSSGGFPLLRVLKLWELEELEEWIVEKGALTILREVEIRSCNKLKMIPDGFKHLVHCCELKLTKMPIEFTARVSESQGQDWCKIAHITSIVIK